MRFESGELILSSIYDWFRQDFGGSRQAVPQHLRAYADPPLAERLQSFAGSIDDDYDWSLNE